MYINVRVCLCVPVCLCACVPVCLCVYACMCNACLLHYTEGIGTCVCAHVFESQY